MNAALPLMNVLSSVCPKLDPAHSQYDTLADLDAIVPLLQRAAITSVHDLADFSAPEVAADMHMPAHILPVHEHWFSVPILSWGKSV